MLTHPIQVQPCVWNPWNLWSACACGHVTNRDRVQNNSLSRDSQLCWANLTRGYSFCSSLDRNFAKWMSSLLTWRWLVPGWIQRNISNGFFRECLRNNSLRSEVGRKVLTFNSPLLPLLPPLPSLSSPSFLPSQR
jgi:hypothetical protein